ncbi:MAG: iduronate sulfatase [Spirochaetaceae bacterium]|nr:MAG: iduronate sulfatase [Spirochaetaceae bacterium]
MNVLMISVDDMRPLLGAYGCPEMITPHIDRLCAEGVRFTRAYCQVPVCGASRASLLTGVRPTADRFVSYASRADQDAPSVPTLLHHLRDNGYELVGNHKVFHDRADHAAVWHRYLQSRLPGFPGPYYGRDAMRMYDSAMDRPVRAGVPTWVHAGPAWECEQVEDVAYHDGEAADFAIREIGRLADAAGPWMVAYGSVDVHLPFTAPKPYWDLYDPTALRLPDHTERPVAIPEQALHAWGELRNYCGIPASGPLDDLAARALIHGYRAGISYLDAQIGRILDVLDRHRLWDSTIVVLWVDHGFTLGEHGLWCKHCLYETALRVPLIVRAPASLGLPSGAAIDTVVENLDIYPTICDLAGLRTPAHVEGRSLIPLLRNAGNTLPGRAYSRYRAGESVRTDRYRYSEWREDDKIVARTLFDLAVDPDEQCNIADEETSRSITESFSSELDALRGSSRLSG